MKRKERIAEVSLEAIEAMEVEVMEAIFDHRDERVCTVLAKVEEHFYKGSARTRTLIENHFILPLSTLLEMNMSWGEAYLHCFPARLREAYCRQVNCAGI